MSPSSSVFSSRKSTSQDRRVHLSLLTASMIAGRSRHSHEGSPSVIDTSDPANDPTATDVPVEAETANTRRVHIANVAEEPESTIPTLRGIPVVDKRPVKGPGPPIATGRYCPLSNSATRTKLWQKTPHQDSHTYASLLLCGDNVWRQALRGLYESVYVRRRQVQ